MALYRFWSPVRHTPGLRVDKNPRLQVCSLRQHPQGDFAATQENRVCEVRLSLDADAGGNCNHADPDSDFRKGYQVHVLNGSGWKKVDILSDMLDHVKPPLHSFYRLHNFRRNSDEGRKLMLSDLDSIHDTLLRSEEQTSELQSRQY